MADKTSFTADELCAENNDEPCIVYTTQIFSNIQLTIYLCNVYSHWIILLTINSDIQYISDFQTEGSNLTFYRMNLSRSISSEDDI